MNPLDQWLARPFCEVCGKDSYQTEAAARGAVTAKAARAHKGAKGRHGRQPPRGVYACASGNGWHLTSSAGRRNHRRRT